MIAYWVPEDKDTPARLVIMEIPSRIERRSKNLFNVASVSGMLLLIFLLENSPVAPYALNQAQIESRINLW